MRLTGWLLVIFILSGSFGSSLLQAEEVRIRQLEAVQLYTQDELLALIQTNSHLRRVQDDECQLVRDIEARADIMKLPAYQFLWGDMLAYAVCVPRDIERGWQLMQDAAAQGLPEGLEQVGRYYHIGRFVQPDERKAIQYLREAAALGNLAATIRLAGILLDGAGSPRDYEQVYRWLHHSVTADTSTHQTIADLLRQFEQRMPERVVLRAREPVR
ncbi:MAG: sel1 repeat family protein [Alkalimonas sp.]|nr:sel1 repeat family protein [Alkalimonas sp.]